MQAGDIVFVRGESVISKIVRMFDKGRYSHVALAVSSTHVVDADFKTKVQIRKFSEEDFDVVDLRLPEEKRDVVVHEAIQLVGANYDYLQILGYIFSKELGTPKNYICSELIHVLMKKVGVHVGNRSIKPNELYREIFEKYGSRVSKTNTA